MHNRYILSIISLILAGTMIGIPVLGLPMVGFPLHPSPPTGPYQDTEFLELANSTIYDLTNQSLPNGTELRDLQTIQQQLARMNISPELYPEAEQINAYLYYTAKAGDEYSEALSFTSKPYSPAFRDTTLYGDAYTYQNASRTIWNQIKGRYPGIVPYSLSSPLQPFSTNENKNFNWPFNSPFAQNGT